MTVPTVAEKLALDAPAAAVTLAGTVTVAWLLDNAMFNPPAGAAPLKVAVHATVPAALRFPGVQVRPLTVTAAVRLMATLLVTPPEDAVITVV